MVKKQKKQNQNHNRMSNKKTNKIDDKTRESIKSIKEKKVNSNSIVRK